MSRGKQQEDRIKKYDEFKQTYIALLDLAVATLKKYQRNYSSLPAITISFKDIQGIIYELQDDSQSISNTLGQDDPNIPADISENGQKVLQYGVPAWMFH